MDGTFTLIIGHDSRYFDPVCQTADQKVFFKKMELCIAVCLAGCYKSTKGMAHRYRHTKKKRTRKKYEKRILAWFGEVWGKCSD